MRMPSTQITPEWDSDEEERTIVKAVLGGERVEYELLVRRYQKPIYHLMYRVAQDVMTAEDLTQEVFTRAYEKLYTFKMRKRFFPWLYTIAINLCKDYIKRQGIRDNLFQDKSNNETWSLLESDGCAKNMDCVLEVNQIAAIMEKLSSLYSEPLLLYYREGLAVKEIAGVLGISVTAVKARIHRGRKLIKDKLGVGDEKT